MNQIAAYLEIDSMWNSVFRSGTPHTAHGHCPDAPRMSVHWPSWVLMACLSAATLGAFSRTATAEQLLQPKDIARLQFVTHTAISPNGKHVAYNLSVPRQPLQDPDGSAWSELHVVNRQGESRPFIVGHQRIGAAHWAADGSALLYLAKRNDDKATSLYRIPIDGGESQRVLTWSSGIADFAIAPDGKRVAFLATEDADTEQDELRTKGFNQEIYEEDWRPTRVWIANLDDTSSPRMLELPGSASAVAWNPQRDELSVVLAPTALVDDSYMHKRVRIVDVASGQITERIENPGKLGAVAWSPDGRHLAMISGVDIGDPKDGRLMIVPIPSQNAELRDLMSDLPGHVTSFAWRDAETIVWTADVGTRSQVGTVTLAGSQQTIISDTGTVVGDISLSDDGISMALAGHTAEHPPEAFVWTEDHGLQRLTTSNPWLDKMKFAKQETITWQARDGLELEGVLVYPYDYVEGRRYPLIMLVHGGPESHVSDGWVTSYSRPGQMGAARGFAVFYPNYRGSTGRGVKFSKLGQADAAGKEFDDLVDGVDHLVEMGLVDRDRVGITGGSYGGYASAWGATYYSDRFAASVMFVGISDAISKMGTTDIPEEMYLVHHLKRLWDDWQYFYERSPIRYVERNKTPTLILHGKEDPRVHPSQSLELYRHLKTLDQAPVRLVLYEGEGHGNRKAAARLDYNLRLLRWMEHYLQGPGGDAPPLEIDYAEALK